LVDVTIYDYTQGRDEQAVLKAERGRIRSSAGGARLTLVLMDGEMHRPLPPSTASIERRYETLQFDRHVIHFNLSDAIFTRSTEENAARSTRTMPLSGLLETTDSLRANLEADYAGLLKKVESELFPEPSADSLRPDSLTASPDSSLEHPLLHPVASLDSISRQTVTTIASRNARSIQSRIQNAGRDIEWKDRRLRSYQVEIHKKFSIAVACIIFMFIGAPLGLALQRSGLATIGGVALGIFMFYWITLVQGEKLSERGFFPPWIGMWIANLLMSGVGLWLLVYVILDLGATPPLRTRLWTWLTSDTS
jgi:lipopolysaccharide export system permease protein